MNTIKYVFLFTSFFLMLQCNMQDKNDRETIEETVEGISPGVPFTLDREKMFLKLPDDFADENVKGIVGLTVYIDSSEKLQGFKIMKLHIESNGKVDINFVNEFSINRPFSKEEYPKEVQQYYPIIENYIDGLQFEREERIPLRELNEITFIARLK